MIMVDLKITGLTTTIIYDGEMHSVENVFSVLPEQYKDFVRLREDFIAEHEIYWKAGRYEIILEKTDFIYDEENYQINIVQNASLEINRRNITIQTGSREVNYPNIAINTRILIENGIAQTDYIDPNDILWPSQEGIGGKNNIPEIKIINDYINEESTDCYNIIWNYGFLTVLPTENVPFYRILGIKKQQDFS